MDRLQGKVAIVTGAGRGIGQAIALALAKEGTKVVIVARTRADVEKTAEEVGTFGGYALPIAADVTDKSQVRQIIEETVTTFAGIDILVYSAGIHVKGPIEDLAEESWDMVLDTNLKGVFLTTQAVLPQMFRQRDGHIVNIGTNVIFGRMVKAGWEAISAAKFGLLGFSRALMASVEGSGIKVSVLHPGATNSWGGSPDPARKLEVEDITNLVVYLTTLPKHIYIREVVIETRDYTAARKNPLRDWVG